MRVTPEQPRNIGRKPRRVAAVQFAVAVVALVAAGCGSSTTHPAASGSAGSAGSVTTTAPPTTTAPQTTAAPQTPAKSATTMTPVPAAVTAIMVGHTSLGSILTDGHGQTVYLFEKDTGAASNCFGACASAWPPVTTTAGQPTVVGGGNQALLGTTMRTDGTTQLTYGGHPLYRFVGDHKPGDTTGQGLKAFGAGWYVLAPSGQKVETGG
jgi:predicted lipoprotein with Yx(FWY)xxD motif